MNKARLRSFQAHFPWIPAVKFGLRNQLTRRFGRSIDPDFRLLADLPRPDTILDIGGNWGQSIHAFRYLAKPRQIVSFEPSPYLARKLRDAFAGDGSVRIEQFALGASEGQFTLYTPVYRDYVWDGLASTIESEARSWLNAERLSGFDPNLLRLQTDSIQVRTLDSFNLDASVIKIDVQGAETAVVQGGIETFRRNRPVSLIEDPKPELIDLLGGIGLHPYHVMAKRLVRGDLGGKNTVFMPEETVETLRGRGYSVG